MALAERQIHHPQPYETPKIDVSRRQPVYLESYINVGNSSPELTRASGAKMEKSTIGLPESAGDINWEQRRKLLQQEVEMQKEKSENVTLKMEEKPNIFKRLSKFYSSSESWLKQKGNGVKKWMLDLGEKSILITVPIEIGAVGIGLLTNNPEWVVAGAFGLVVDAVGWDKIKEEKKKAGYAQQVGLHQNIPKSLPLAA